MEKIDLTTVRESVKFNLTGDTLENKNIFELQEKGVLGIWNILVEKKIALLADEVGMGKTLQAISIISIMLKQNPDSKFLIFAPNEIVQKNWLNEFNKFRPHDSIRNNNESPLADYVLSKDNIFDLFQGSSNKGKRIFLTRLTSLSYLESDNNRNKYSKDLNINEKSNRWLDEAIQKIYNLYNIRFDLCLVDEAHKLRNYDKGSNRVENAKKIFLNNNEYLCKNVLLMTATPNHSHKNDVQNIVKYFNYQNKKSESTSIDILNDICIRRPRHLESLNKYDYREETGVSLKFSPSSEIFYALYQKLLIEEQEKLKIINTNAGSGRLFFGYLEAFESFDFQDQSQALSENSNSKDIHKKIEIEDQVLSKLKEPFSNQNNFSTIPHPKFDSVTKIEKRDIYESYKNKKLIFVRRIASSSELSSRFNSNINDLLIERLSETICDYLDQKNFKFSANMREDIIHIFKEKSEDDTSHINDLEDQNEDIDGNLPTIFNIFKRIKNSKEEAPPHSQVFRRRFFSPSNIFSIFFDLGLDLYKAKYTIKHIININKKNDYVSTLKNYREGLSSDTLTKQDKNLNINTFFTKYFEIVDNELVHQKWNNFSVEMKNNFSLYIKRGLLFASPYIVDLYIWYIEALKNFKKESEFYESRNLEKLYEALLHKVEDEFKNPKINLKEFITYSLLNFGTIFDEYKKDNNSWNFLDNQLPSYGYTADSKNDSVLKSFNTPFYPHFLISTSVLQEGVNLHLNCNRVIHYGIAWTVGDNEQRVGRVDRLFGKVHSLIKENPTDKNSRLYIEYPYLSGTLDEEQLKQFIVKKFESESLIDKMETIPEKEDSNEFNLNVEIENWKNYLRIPGKNSIILEDRYPKFLNLD